MIAEYSALFLSSYLIVNLLLLPLVTLYLILDHRRVPLHLLLRLHKGIIAASLCLPLLLPFYQQSATALFDKTPSAAQTTTAADGPEFSRQALADAGNAVSPLRDIDLSLTDWLFYLSDFLRLLIALGVVVFMLRLAAQSYALYRLRKEGWIDRLSQGVELISSPHIEAPFAVALFKRRVYLPESLAAQHKELVIQHELNHFALRHHRWAFLESLLRHLFWFNPVLHWLARRGVFYRELECDLLTIEQTDRYSYARALLDTAQRACGSHALVSIQRWVDKNSLRDRLEYLLGARHSRRRRLWGGLAIVAVIITLIPMLLLGRVNDRFLEERILASIQEQYAQTLASRNSVTIAQVPQHLIDALLVHEDKNFYDHQGLSITAAIRALGGNLISASGQGPRYGASTLSMQLGRSFLDNKERSYERKIRELKVARVLEKHFPKQDILEMYLNRVYFGEGAWGLYDAAQLYFERPYSELSREEAAMLVPFLQAPSAWNMKVNPQLAAANQAALLKRMAQE